MKKLLVTLAGAILLSSVAHAEPASFEFLQSADGGLRDCGTFIHEKGDDPNLGVLRAFMSTDKALYVRLNGNLKVLELVKVEQKMRDTDILGRGDVVTLYFKNEKKERAKIRGVVTQAVIDEHGGYPVIEMDTELSFANKMGVSVSQSSLVAHDMCL